ncbi:hypothetical protein [Flavobacterium sp.]|uniref:hypothetical protein n=1 Tax=Flavobacterium sp. TaxID=239 RepID=UPI001201F445|nr:hypothetical protein [Flavobacterium sp.]RZJ69613.1 MAG: hypothetical protein EOO49_16820 [Flavobacterium sp.]
MKKVFLFLLASMAMVSCGSDDGDGGSKRPSSVTIVGGNESYLFSMTYDKGRLNTLSSNYGGAHTFTFAYNGQGKVSTVSATGSTTDPIAFTYDGSGKLSSVTRSGQTFPVTWSDATTANIDGSTVKVDERGDIVMMDGAIVTRDTGKGAFANVKGVDGLTLYLTEILTFYYAGKRPLKTVTGSGVGVVFSNETQGGMLKSATFASSGTTYTMNITY